MTSPCIQIKGLIALTSVKTIVVFSITMFYTLPLVVSKKQNKKRTDGGFNNTFISVILVVCQP